MSTEEKRLELLEEQVKELSALAARLQKYLGAALIAGPVIAATLGINVYSAINDAKAASADAAAAEATAASAVASLASAKEDAVKEIQSQGVKLLGQYRGAFSNWVEEEKTGVVPRGVAVPLVDGSDVPVGWQLCDGQNGTPILDVGSVLVAGKPPLHGPDGIIAAAEIKREFGLLNNKANGGVSNIYMSAHHVRYICRRAS
jgi:hypothetical protein